MTISAYVDAPQSLRTRRHPKVWHLFLALVSLASLLPFAAIPFAGTRRSGNHVGAFHCHRLEFPRRQLSCCHDRLVLHRPCNALALSFPAGPIFDRSLPACCRQCRGFLHSPSVLERLLADFLPLLAVVALSKTECRALELHRRRHGWRAFVDLGAAHSGAGGARRHTGILSAL